MVLAHRVQDVHQLPFVFVDALDLHVEQRVWTDVYAELGGGETDHCLLARAALGGKGLPEPGIVRKRYQSLQRGRLP